MRNRRAATLHGAKPADAHRGNAHVEPAPERAREHQPKPYVVGFFLVPDFPLMAFAAAIEPLRSANRLSRESLYRWRLLSRDGAPVRASNGVDIAVHAAIDDTHPLDLVLACAGTRDAGAGDAAVATWLRSLARRGTDIGAISLGAYVIANAGLLDGRRCALHWESLAAFAEQFPRIRTTSDIFVVDGNRRTCSGGTAALDMMLQLITERQGRALASDVSEQFLHPRIRDMRDPQRMDLPNRLGVMNERLVSAIALMELPVDEPRPVNEIATQVGLSPRQLERLFERHLHASPSRYYLKLRLDRARSMLLQTTKPILDVAVACGFASASHFSRCYRTQFGHRPRDERGGLSPTAPRSRRA